MVKCNFWCYGKKPFLHFVSVHGPSQPAAKLASVNFSSQSINNSLSPMQCATLIFSLKSLSPIKISNTMQNEHEQTINCY